MINYKNTVITYNNKTIPVLIKKQSNSKSITIRPNIINQGVTVNIPKYATFNQGFNALERNIVWLYNILLKNEPKQLSNVLTIEILGKKYRIIKNNTKGFIKIQFDENNNIIITGDLSSSTKVSKKIQTFLKKIALDYFTKETKLQTKKLNIDYNLITLRDGKTRWGSCSSLKNLSYNWRLVMAPEFVASYIVCHEVCHLVHFNHTKNFWNLVQSLHPNIEAAKEWLKNNGNSLHLYY